MGQSSEPRFLPDRICVSCRCCYRTMDCAKAIDDMSQLPTIVSGCCAPLEHDKAAPGKQITLATRCVWRIILCCCCCCWSYRLTQTVTYNKRRFFFHFTSFQQTFPQCQDEARLHSCSRFLGGFDCPIGLRYYYYNIQVDLLFYFN